MIRPDLVLIALALLLSADAVLAAGRHALVNSQAARLNDLQQRGQRRAGWAQRVAEDATRLMVSLGLAQNVVRLLVLGLALAGFGASAAGGWPAALRWFGVLFAAALLLAAVEAVAGASVMRSPETWAVRLIPFIGPVVTALSPLGEALLRLSGWLSLSPAKGRSALVTEEEIKTLVDAGEEGGAIEEEEKDMIFSIFQLGDTLAREVMVPRIDIVAFEASTPLDQVTVRLIETGHSRAPVYSGTIDQIVGLVYGKDLLAALHGGAAGQTVASVMRKAVFVPEAKKVGDLLQEMQARRVQMVIVVDEYGGTAGLVTLEDIVEEIVGEIRDEYDQAEEPPYQELPGGEYSFNGGVNLEDVNDLTGSRLSKETSDTLGGLIFSLLGRVPAVGESVEAGGLKLTVEQVSGRRIRRVRASRVEPQGMEAQTNADHDTAEE